MNGIHYVFSRRGVQMVQRTLGVIVASHLLMTTSSAQQPGSNDDARSSYNRFLQEAGKAKPGTPIAVPTPSQISPLPTPAVRFSPDRNKMFDQLLSNQEKRTPQPNARSYVLNSQLLALTAQSPDTDFAQVLFWNEVALNLTARDHTPAPASLNINTNPFEQVGPPRTSRAMAIVHLAMFEAINTIEKTYPSYKNVQADILSTAGFEANVPSGNFSIRRAIAQSAYFTLATLYPEKREYLNIVLVANITALQEETPKGIAGMKIGEAAARRILHLRWGDNWDLQDPPAPLTTNDPLQWIRDPLNNDPAVAIGGNWNQVIPFVLIPAKINEFRPPPPPPQGSARYQADFQDVFDKGGAGNIPLQADRGPTVTTRTDTETFIGKFWAYDATPNLCAPPRLYNMIATSLALKEKRGSFPDAITLARYLALVNVTLADAAIGGWDAKFTYRYARPVTAIRALAQNATLWTPLGAPVTNGPPGRLNFTPPFPAYPSGHAVFGGAFFQVLRRFYFDNHGPGDIQPGEPVQTETEDTPSAFRFISDEYNGENHDPSELVDRPRIEAHFFSFEHAEKENARSRVYLGVHWRFDGEEGVTQGRKIGNYVFDNLYNQ